MNAPDAAGKFALQSDLFAAHFVDPVLPGAVKRVTARRRETGLVTLSGLTTRAAVLGFARQVMDVQRQRDSGPDGLTAIDDTGQHQVRWPRFSGQSSLGPGLHTEGSARVTPPRLVLLVCTEPASQGGHSLLVDGRCLYAETEDCPEAVAALSNPRAGFFGRSGGTFAQHDGGRVSVRFRQDELVRWHPLARLHLHALRMAAVRHQQMLTLEAGQGYLLDNHRWLHGRTAFHGARRCYRALGNPHEHAPPGFLPRSTGGGAA
ncbi:TauD/TfdA family dioxygenase [Streptomyces syringium]|uniref:TauD/TfdA family dioxygenase n=1 Tax=Streptomyces syringium TaxID=76729 RepID=UPI0033BFDC6E